MQATCDVAIIGAGPAGSVAAALLHKRGHSVLVLEKAQFPRFSIGESLLPQCMVFLEQAGLLDAVADDGFQYKEGAAFAWGDRYTAFDFRDKFGEGPGTTFQVQRARFDQRLADAVAAQGVPVRFRQEVLEVTGGAGDMRLRLRDGEGVERELRARFVLDASGFARVLPRLLALDKPSDFPVRASLFCHIEDGIADGDFDRNKILVTIHPRLRDVWYWLIPFGNGRCSLGVVAEQSVIDAVPGSEQARLQQFVAQVPQLARLLRHARYLDPARQITGYAADVSSLHGDGFALLGNAGEFLDPVFSSGVTIAMKSASLAAATLDRQLRGEPVDWAADYAQPLMLGVDCFRTYVSAWYDGRFQDVIFATEKNAKVRQMISAILAGYAWDQHNPFATDSERRLDTLVQLVRLQPAAL